MGPRQKSSTRTKIVNISGWLIDCRPSAFQEMLRQRPVRRRFQTVHVFGLWNCFQSRSAAKRRRRSWTSSNGDIPGSGIDQLGGYCIDGVTLTRAGRLPRELVEGLPVPWIRYLSPSFHARAAAVCQASHLFDRRQRNRREPWEHALLVLLQRDST